MTEAVAAAIRERLELVTVDQVCELLRVTRSWVYDEVEAGRMPCVRLGRQLRFRASAIEAWLEQHSGDPAAMPIAPAVPARRRGRPRKA
jgi:excisionase family DNA binding protein